jgi:hypothetical protein
VAGIANVIHQVIPFKNSLPFLLTYGTKKKSSLFQTPTSKVKTDQVPDNLAIKVGNVHTQDGSPHKEHGVKNQEPQFLKEKNKKNNERPNQS